MKRLSLLLLLALAGCQHPMGAPIGSFGDAVRHNVQLQVIDPEPLVAAPPPDFDGARAALAMGRYQQDTAGRAQGPGPDRQDVEDVETQVGLPAETLWFFTNE